GWGGGPPAARGGGRGGSPPEPLSGERSFEAAPAERRPQRARVAVLQQDRPVVDAGHGHREHAAAVLAPEGGPARALLAERHRQRDTGDRVVHHVVVLHYPPRIGAGAAADD